jgi:hypothetical protein
MLTVEDMDIGSAHTNAEHADQNLSRAGRRLLNLVKLNLTGGGHHCLQHGKPPEINDLVRYHFNAE